MFLSGLNTAYLSDLNADKYAEKLSLNWQRTKTAVVLGGIDNDKLYIHIANPNMGMSVIGKNTNIYPLSSVRGVVPANSIYKNKNEIVEKI